MEIRVEEKIDIKSLNLKELSELVLSMGEKRFRAKQIYEWLHVKQVTSFDEMTNLSKKFVEQLKEQCTLDAEYLIISHQDCTLRQEL